MKYITRTLPRTIISYIVVDDKGGTTQHNECVDGKKLNDKQAKKHLENTLGTDRIIVDGVTYEDVLYRMNVGTFIANAELVKE